MYNMERYCTRPYCIENLYWTSRLRRLVQYGFSIQYRLVQYLYILYITLYNNLLLLYSYNLNPIKNIHLRHVTVHYVSRIVQPEAIFFPYWTSNITRIFQSLYYAPAGRYINAWMHSLKKSVKPEIVNRYDLWVLRYKIGGAKVTRIIQSLYYALLY
jgi:hypothetical protein